MGEPVAVNIKLMRNGDTESHESVFVPKERVQWARKSEFMLACIGYAVGMARYFFFVLDYLCVLKYRELCTIFRSSIF